MADLVTHMAVVLLPAALTRPRLAPVAAFGAVLPDLLGRAFPLALERLGAPGALLWPWAALHEPAGWLLSSALIASAYVRADRAAVFGALCVGGALHTGLDVLQFHHGEGYLLLAPLSDWTFELGWMGSEATVPYAPRIGALTAIAWAPWAVERWGTPRLPLASAAIPLAIASAAWAAGAPWVAAGALVALVAARRWFTR